ncbi:MAG: hypothetical protein HY897_00710 [Deltaproteobacteria bacterium]|nr:hypothetical protein [Deltaproteobacteria bacterium]
MTGAAAVALLSAGGAAAGGTTDAGNAARPESACAACHAARDSEHVGKWSRSVHARAKVGCAACHGGDESKADKSGAHGVPPRRVTRAGGAACAGCHEAVVSVFKTSRHAAAARRGMPAPGCADCHARAGSDLHEGAELERRCATCHRTGGVAGRTWVPKKATVALDLLMQVSLARAVLLERIDQSNVAQKEGAALRKRLSAIDSGFKGIAVEWHRFSLHDVEARAIKALDALEEMYREMEK